MFGNWRKVLNWGQGILVEVMPELFDYGFNVLNLNRIEGFVDNENLQCKRALAKVGFEHEGTMRECEFEKGRFISLDIYARLKNA